MAEVLTLLLWLVVVAIVVYVVLWVLAEVGVPIPPKVARLIWVAVTLVILIYLVNRYATSLPSL